MNRSIHEFIAGLDRLLQHDQVISAVQVNRNIVKILSGHGGRLRAGQGRVNEEQRSAEDTNSSSKSRSSDSTQQDLNSRQSANQCVSSLPNLPVSHVTRQCAQLN